jgi:hypothetical protein
MVETLESISDVKHGVAWPQYVVGDFSGHKVVIVFQTGHPMRVITYEEFEQLRQ